ncbi:chromosome segregation and condensation protein ScpA [Methylobacterium sp. 4-46]|uniref:segregation and condensation protein A n=1 Tax=unclassified Methylobacterium TaxID=2615210 RepID=UPI000152D664|nr:MULTISPECIES: ScpA family protein [Methylobacterium]ACA16935.1 chromosome segregation and condensation protein ScpA [Methylobacterium sp. 4-46]WFT82621.1 ScpA family protein [Methylobacterium nodulans]
MEAGTGSAPEAGEDPTLVVDVDGYEGPLDLLLDLARRQKVDLGRISILALTEQYLAFVEEARRLRLELAADYLVMAAWLAYLKSRLLLPAPPRGPEPSADALAGVLAQRLRRLEAVRDAAGRLLALPQLGRDVFARGEREAAPRPAGGAFAASLHDLLAAYARQRAARAGARVCLSPRQVWSLLDAREALERLIGPCDDWTTLDACLAAHLADPARRASVRASSLSAALELAREGRITLRQDAPFAPLWLRPAAGEGG